MAHTILVGFDGSAWAHAAVSMAGWLAKQTQSTVLVLEAVQQEAAPGPAGRRSLVARYRASLAAVDSEVARLESIGVKAEGIAVLGEPVRRIMRAIEDVEPAMVVVGTFGQRPVDNWLLGSVADKLARSAPVPVLLIPRPGHQPPAADRPLRVLVPVDGSREAMVAVTQLAGLGSNLVEDLTLLEVLEQSVTPGQADRLAGVRGNLLHHYLMEIAQDVRLPDFRPDVALRSGQPARQILRFAQDGGYDLIAMTRYGLGGHRQLLLGRVAEAVVRQSQLPVLIVPPPGMSGAANEAEYGGLRVAREASMAEPNVYEIVT